jgi:hypothetical protein
MRLLVSLLSISTLSLLVGCGHLSRADAAQEIERSVYLKVPQFASLDIGRFTTEGGLRCYRKVPDPLQKWALSRGLISAATNSKSVDYELTEVGRSFIEIEGEKVNISSADNGCVQSYVEINLARSTGVDVFGVLEDGNSATVEFATHWKLTDAGVELVGNSKFRSTLSPEELATLNHDASSPLNESTSLNGVTISPDMTAIGYQGKARFLKFDDGWRLDKIN